jgi:poly(A) polymerase
LALAGAALDVQTFSGYGQDIRSLFESSTVRHLERSIDKALRLSNYELDELTGTLEGIQPLLRDDPPRIATLKRFLNGPTASNSRHLLDALAQTGCYQERIEWLKAQLGAIEQIEYAPTPFISGDDLTAARLVPGPAFKRILDTVYDAQLEGKIQSQAEALQLALNIASSNAPP